MLRLGRRETHRRAAHLPPPRLRRGWWRPAHLPRPSRPLPFQSLRLGLAPPGPAGVGAVSTFGGRREVVRRAVDRAATVDVVEGVGGHIDHGAVAELRVPASEVAAACSRRKERGARRCPNACSAVAKPTCTIAAYPSPPGLLRVRGRRLGRRHCEAQRRRRSSVTAVRSGAPASAGAKGAPYGRSGLFSLQAQEESEPAPHD